jgi:hypothetical protein
MWKLWTDEAVETRILSSLESLSTSGGMPELDVGSSKGLKLVSRMMTKALDRRIKELEREESLK